MEGKPAVGCQNAAEANEYCPGLAKHIYISNNSTTSIWPKALLIEVGGDGNLVEECLGCKYLAAALNDVINGG